MYTISFSKRESLYKVSIVNAIAWIVLEATDLSKYVEVILIKCVEQKAYYSCKTSVNSTKLE